MNYVKTAVYSGAPIESHLSEANHTMMSRRGLIFAAGAWACTSAQARSVDTERNMGLPFREAPPGHVHRNFGYGASANHPAAVDAAQQIRLQGGGVFDMYLAALAAAWVVDPANCSPFGRMQGLYLSNGNYSCLHAATQIRNEPGSTVPFSGNIPAYFHMRNSGRLRLSMASILAPAIAIALKGYRPTDALRVAIRSSAEQMHPTMRAIYVDDDGQVRSHIRNPQLAEFLEVLAMVPDEGGLWDELYTRSPGPWHRNELPTNAPRQSQPKGFDVRAPDGQTYQLRTTGNLETWGTWTLLSASITADLQASGVLSTLETAMEAYLLATILVLDRIPFKVGTLKPKTANPSVDIDLQHESREIAQRVRKLLAASRADLWADLDRTYFAGGASNTDDTNTNAFAFAVNDELLSFTTSMGPWFGSKRSWFGAGLAYSYAMKSGQLFTGQTHDATEMSSLIIEREGKPWLAMGAAGSERIFGSLTYLLFLKLGLNHGVDMAELMMIPRLFPKDSKVRIHPDMPKSIQQHLVDRGFNLDVTRYDLQKHLGIVNLVEQVRPGVFRSGADPSGDGGAL
ncbi:gamma-glutamyltransferase [Comamonas odontotermitis]|uniref:gamma-glutamyltransferase n=1 Tax=Comamonas odontotermitis TaxID=379895 RepID=UPI001CC6221F|nr:gamma-glutamyltransferase [Comamonas odontotermitis]UBB15384.1 gamma-glutamyltransferase family protein [Comamonas odontotermitis]